MLERHQENETGQPNYTTTMVVFDSTKNEEKEKKKKTCTHWNLSPDFSFTLTGSSFQCAGILFIFFNLLPFLFPCPLPNYRGLLVCVSTPMFGSAESTGGRGS